MKMHADNKGLTVKLNFWPTDKCPDAESARQRIKGQVSHPATKAVKKFNSADELIAILGEWNADQFERLQVAK